MILLEKLFWDRKKDRTKYKVFLVFSLLYALFEHAPTGAALNKAFISVGGIICLIMWVGLVLGINFIAIARVQDARKISDCQ